MCDIGIRDLLCQIAYESSVFEFTSRQHVTNSKLFCAGTLVLRPPSEVNFRVQPRQPSIHSDLRVVV